MSGADKAFPAGSAYFVPGGPAQTEFTEKRSRFLTHIWPVESEEEARAAIARTKERYHDARHNCWCYLLREGGVVRYSDDGEPQGTAGQPMLEVFQRESVKNVCCVVTRYFGGILLGAGGLTRAYARAAAQGLAAAGIAVMGLWKRLELTCPYHLLELIKQEMAAAGAVQEEIQYGEAVALTLLVPQGAVQAFCGRVTERSAGGVTPRMAGEVFRPVSLANT